MRLALPACLLLLAACTVPAPEDEADDSALHTAEQMRALCDEAFALIVAADYEGAAALLKPHWAKDQGQGAAYLPPPGIITSGQVYSTGFVRHQFYGEGAVRFQYELETEHGGTQQFACVFTRQGEPWQFSRVVWGEFTMHSR